jgi:DNA-binding MarR family transcriptional regulator
MSGATLDDTKECPYCGEEIKRVAVRCKHCHADLTIPPTPLLSGSTAAPACAPPAPLAPAPVLGAPAQGSASILPVSLASAQVTDLLSRLVDKNLVVYEPDEHGHVRYRLLETVRQYARERLAESGEASGDAEVQPLRQRHRDEFLRLAEEARSRLSGPEQGQWLSRLESEHDEVNPCRWTPTGLLLAC